MAGLQVQLYVRVSCWRSGQYECGTVVGSTTHNVAGVVGRAAAAKSGARLLLGAAPGVSGRRVDRRGFNRGRGLASGRAGAALSESEASKGRDGGKDGGEAHFGEQLKRLE